MEPSSKDSPKLLNKFLSLIESALSSDRFILRLSFFIVIATGIWLLFSVNQDYSEVTPTRGGSITEGILGTPRFVNPALAITRADQDVTALVYSGLMKIAPDGSLVNDLAKSITVSEDGLTYHVILKSDVKFHDNTPLTAKDVVYTLLLIQDPSLKSPLRGNWTNVTVEKTGEYELNITLNEAYAPFMENFTVGIMPAHLWSSLPIEQLPFSQLNTEPIGTGPFMIVDAERDTSGLIDRYTLNAFRQNNTDPKIDTIKLAFFQNEKPLLEALKNNKIDATAYISPPYIKEAMTNNYKLISEPLPRSFGIFFNQNHSTVLRDAAVRLALTTAINKDALIEKTLYGYGVPISGPTVIPELELESEEGTNTISTTTPAAEQAIKILKEDGWLKNNLGLWEKEIDKETVTLSITLRTSNTPLFVSLVNEIAKQWKKIGVEVVIEQFEQTGLVQSVIRPRDFQALLFGLDMSRSYDLYPFWHSSQQDDPGLNIAQYTNVSVDNLLETARTDQSNTTRLEALKEASQIIAEEQPAIFLFQPTFTYLVNKDVTVTDMNNLGQPSDRFSNVADWHTESDSLWPIFQNDM